jgi:tight adherence protein C
MVRRKQRRHDIAVVRSLPDAIDLFVVAIRAGLTPELAVRRLAEVVTEPIGTALRGVASQVDSGTRFADALDGLVIELGEPARALVAAVTAAERYGLPLAPALDAAARHARDERRRRRETAARQLPVKLAFPLVGCVLPAFAVLTVVPALIGALGALKP